MEKEIEISHYGASYWNRKKYWVLSFLGIVSLFSLLFWIFKGPKEALLPTLLFSLGYGLFFLNKLHKNKIYLVDFTSDTNMVKIRYYNKNKELFKESTLNSTTIKIKNTSWKSFDCKLKLVVEGQKFIIDNAFDWSFTNMKNLFNYIKFYKNEPLSLREKQILFRMEESIEKNRKKYLNK